MPGTRSVAGWLLVPLALGCGRDDPTLMEPSHQVSSLAVSGRVLGPDGRNICRTIGEGTMLLRLLNPEFGISSDVAILAQQDLTCPDNAYSIAADAGTAFLRVELPVNDNLGALPWRTLDQFAASPTHNLRVREGTPLGGGATLDGQPFPGVGLTLAYDFNPNFGVTFGQTGPDGGWTEFFGRSSVILQNGTRYVAQTSCGVMLGTRQLSSDPDGGFLFPTGRSALDCELETGAVAQFTHDLNRLAVTPLPGDIGGSLQSVLSAQYGLGYGVQFPIQPGAPVHAGTEVSHIFNGGLIVGVGPDRILTGFPAQGMLECIPECHDLGLDGTVEFDPSGSPARQAVTWRYSDATSAEKVGLRVIQRSIDGARGQAYVLFRFVFRNTSQSALTFFAGFAGDWDVDQDPLDDQGFTALNRKLMFQVSPETGNHVGTMLLGGVPVSGTYFITPDEFPSEAVQMRALRGTLRRPTAGPTDLRNIHAAGPISLQPGETRDIWLAVVAGENRTRLLSNARAAEADVMSRLTETVAEQAVNAFQPPRAVAGAGRASARPGKPQWGFKNNR
jgi:hypothetical protein